MTTARDGVDWRLGALLAVLVGAGVLQVVVAVEAVDEDVQLVVIGTASIVMLLAIGVVAWFARGLQHDGRDVGSDRDRQQ